MQAYVVTEGEHDARLLEKLLPDDLSANIKFVVGKGTYSAESLARSIISTRRLPVFLVLDADTSDERAVLERRELLRELLRQAAPSIRSDVFLAVPEIETIYFTDPSTAEAITGSTITKPMFEAAKFRPKKVLVDLLGHLNGGNIQQELIARIDDPAILDQLRKHPLVQELYEFLSLRELKDVTAKGPATFLDAIFEVIPNYRRERGLYYAGIIENVGRSSGGAGQGPHPTDAVFFHLRDGIDLSDAKPLLNLALDKVAVERNMKQERQKIKLFYEDETGQDQEL